MLKHQCENAGGVIRSTIMLLLLVISQMWPDDEHWHPIIFGGKKFSAYFLFEGLDKIVQHKIDEKDHLILVDEGVL